MCWPNQFCDDSWHKIVYRNEDQEDQMYQLAVSYVTNQSKFSLKTRSPCYWSRVCGGIGLSDCAGTFKCQDSWLVQSPSAGERVSLSHCKPFMERLFQESKHKCTKSPKVWTKEHTFLLLHFYWPMQVKKPSLDGKSGETNGTTWQKGVTIPVAMEYIQRQWLHLSLFFLITIK